MQNSNQMRTSYTCASMPNCWALPINTTLLKDLQSWQDTSWLTRSSLWVHKNIVNVKELMWFDLNSSNELATSESPRLKFLGPQSVDKWERKQKQGWEQLESWEVTFESCCVWDRGQRTQRPGLSCNPSSRAPRQWPQLPPLILDDFTNGKILSRSHLVSFPLRP